MMLFLAIASALSLLSLETKSGDVQEWRDEKDLNFRLPLTPHIDNNTEPKLTTDHNHQASLNTSNLNSTAFDNTIVEKLPTALPHISPFHHFPPRRNFPQRRLPPLRLRPPEYRYRPPRRRKKPYFDYELDEDPSYPRRRRPPRPSRKRKKPYYNDYRDDDYNYRNQYPDRDNRYYDGPDDKYKMPHVDEDYKPTTTTATPSSFPKNKPIIYSNKDGIYVYPSQELPVIKIHYPDSVYVSSNDHWTQAPGPPYDHSYSLTKAPPPTSIQDVLSHQRGRRPGNRYRYNGYDHYDRQYTFRHGMRNNRRRNRGYQQNQPPMEVMLDIFPSQEKKQYGQPMNLGYMPMNNQGYQQNTNMGYKNNQMNTGYQRPMQNQMGYQNNQMNMGYQPIQMNMGYQPNQMNMGYQNNEMNMGYQPEQMNMGYQNNQMNMGYQNNQMSRGYQDNQMNKGYQQPVHNQMGYQNNQMNTRYKNNQMRGGHQNNQMNKRYRSNQMNMGYKNQQMNMGYQNNQMNMGYQNNQMNMGYQPQRNSYNQMSNGYQMQNRNEMNSGYQTPQTNNRYSNTPVYAQPTTKAGVKKVVLHLNIYPDDRKQSGYSTQSRVTTAPPNYPATNERKYKDLINYLTRLTTTQAGRASHIIPKIIKPQKPNKRQDSFLWPDYYTTSTTENLRTLEPLPTPLPINAKS